jgi:hypothetical protein
MAGSTAEIFLGRFEQAKADARKAMKLSPRDSRKGVWYSYLVPVHKRQAFDIIS